AVVVAQLLAINRADPTEPISAAHHSVLTLRLPAAGQAGVAAVAVLLGGVLVLHAWQADRVHRLRVGAFMGGKPGAKGEAPDYDRALAFLGAAERADPGDADLQVEIGQAYLDEGQLARSLEQVRKRRTVARAQSGLACLAVGSADPFAAVGDLLARDNLDREVRKPSPELEKELFEKFVVPGLRHMALA